MSGRVTDADWEGAGQRATDADWEGAGQRRAPASVAGQEETVREATRTRR